MITVLFVCTGNTCRSPMAEWLLRRAWQQERQSGGVAHEEELRAISAGLAAIPGQGATPSTLEVMNEWGLDVAQHQAQPVTRELVAEADLILTMTRGHKAALLELAPEAAERVFTLKEFVQPDGPDPDIPDPFGHPLETYRATAWAMEKAVRSLVQKLAERLSMERNTVGRQEASPEGGEGA